MGKKRNKTPKIDHTHCEMMLKQKGPHWGMYCQQHGTWIKWLGTKDLKEVMKLDVPMIYEIKS